LLTPDLRANVRNVLEAQLQALAVQGVSGAPNAAILQMAASNVEVLRRWLTAHRLDMAEGPYREGRYFLRTLDTALKAIHAS